MNASAAFSLRPLRAVEWMMGLLVLFACGLVLPLLGLRWMLLLLAATAAAAGLLWFRSWLWLAMILALPFSVEVRHVVGQAGLVLPTELLIPALIGAHLLASVARGRIAYTPSPLNAPVITYAAVMLSGLIVSADPQTTAKAVVRDLGYLIAGYYLATRYLRTRAALTRLLIGLVVANCALAVYGIGTQIYDGFAIYGNIAGPFFENHCIYAAYLAMTMAGLLAALLSSPVGPVLRAVLWCALGLFTVAVGLSFVRGAWLSLIVAGGMVTLLCWRRLRPSFIIGAGVLGYALLMAVAYFELSELFAKRIERAFDTSYVTNHDRIDRWMTAVNMWYDHPLLGVGWGRYPDVYQNYYHYLNAYSIQLRMGAHNLYLEVLAEAGLVGLIVLLWLLTAALLHAWALWRRLRDGWYRAAALGVAAALTTLYVHMIVNNLGPSDKISISFWLLIGLLPVLQRLDGQERADAAS